MTQNDKATSMPAKPVARHPTQSMALTVDFEMYKKLLNDSDWSDDKKQEFLETIWAMMVGFVDLGFGIHPLQAAGYEGCEQALDLSGLVASDMVSSNKSSSTKEFESVASGQKTKAHESEET